MVTLATTGRSATQSAPDHARLQLRADARVRSRRDYAAVFEQGRRFGAPLLALHWLQVAHAPRLGLAVSRKVSPRAVVRNRIKRVLRDEFRQLRHALPAGDYVLVARPPAADAENAALRAALHALLQRAGALPLPPLTGTMPPPSTNPPAAERAQAPGRAEARVNASRAKDRNA